MISTPYISTPHASLPGPANQPSQYTRPLPDLTPPGRIPPPVVSLLLLLRTSHYLSLLHRHYLAFHRSNTCQAGATTLRNLGQRRGGEDQANLNHGQAPVPRQGAGSQVAAEHRVGRPDATCYLPACLAIMPVGRPSPCFPAYLPCTWASPPTCLLLPWTEGQVLPGRQPSPTDVPTRPTKHHRIESEHSTAGDNYPPASLLVRNRNLSGEVKQKSEGICDCCLPPNIGLTQDPPTIFKVQIVIPGRLETQVRWNIC